MFWELICKKKKKKHVLSTKTFHYPSIFLYRKLLMLTLQNSFEYSRKASDWELSNKSANHFKYERTDFPEV